MRFNCACGCEIAYHGKTPKHHKCMMCGGKFSFKKDGEIISGDLSGPVTDTSSEKPRMMRRKK